MRKNILTQSHDQSQNISLGAVHKGRPPCGGEGGFAKRGHEVTWRGEGVMKKGRPLCMWKNTQFFQ